MTKWKFCSPLAKCTTLSTWPGQLPPFCPLAQVVQCSFCACSGGALPSLGLFSLGLKNLESTLREAGGTCRLGSAATAPKSFMKRWDRPSGTEGIFIDYIERITMVRERSRVPTGSGHSCGDCGSWAWLPLSLWAAAHIAF